MKYSCKDCCINYKVMQRTKKLIRLAWVLRHTETADALAKLGSLFEGDSIVSPDPPIGLINGKVIAKVYRDSLLFVSGSTDCSVSKNLAIVIGSWN